MITQIKLDLDLKTKNKVISHLKERLYFAFNFSLLDKKDIISILLIKKKSYSVKIFYSKEIIKQENLIIIQSFLGDDYKRVGICLRDLNLGLENWNRLFDIKKYENDKIIVAKTQDITKLILNEND